MIITKASLHRTWIVPKGFRVFFYAIVPGNDVAIVEIELFRRFHSDTLVSVKIVPINFIEKSAR